jgi:hypothetical protein
MPLHSIKNMPEPTGEDLTVMEARVAAEIARERAADAAANAAAASTASSSSVSVSSSSLPASASAPASSASHTGDAVKRRGKNDKPAAAAAAAAPAKPGPSASAAASTNHIDYSRRFGPTTFDAMYASAAARQLAVDAMRRNPYNRGFAGNWREVLLPPV